MFRIMAFIAGLAWLAMVSPQAFAATWCVRDHNEFQQALTAAAASPQDDEIKLREGIYTTFSSTFTYSTQNAGWLTISGGWYTVDGNDCAQMRLDARRTILDGAGQRRVLLIQQITPQGATTSSQLTVYNLTIANGFGDPATFVRGGGLDMGTYNDGFTSLVVENTIFANNDGYFGGGANFYVKKGSLRIVNSLFDRNRASTTASAHAGITMLATGENVAHAAVIANSTFVGGRCAGNGGRGCGVGAGLGGGVRLDVVNSLFHDNAISDLNLEGLANVGYGNGTAGADFSLVTTVSGNLPLAATNALVGDPRFVDPATFDWRLRDDSPFLDLGRALVPYYAPSILDVHAQRRTRYAAMDPGAFENQNWDTLFANGFN